MGRVRPRPYGVRRASRHREDRLSDDEASHRVVPSGPSGPRLPASGRVPSAEPEPTPRVNGTCRFRDNSMSTPTSAAASGRHRPGPHEPRQRHVPRHRRQQRILRPRRCAPGAPRSPLIAAAPHSGSSTNELVGTGVSRTMTWRTPCPRTSWTPVGVVSVLDVGFSARDAAEWCWRQRCPS